MEDPEWTKHYVSRYRKIFVALMGGVRPSRLTLDDEDLYIKRFMRPTDGPVLDLACGPGRWARTLSGIVGAERTIGLDLSLAMLHLAHEAASDCLFVRGTVLHLPFRASSLGGATCWNALQTLPDPEQVIAEIGRCLRPGGRFSCLTYRKSHSLYRLIQRSWEAIPGVHAFEPTTLRRWLDAAGLQVIDESGPNLVLLLAAEKRR